MLPQPQTPGLRVMLTIQPQGHYLGPPTAECGNAPRTGFKPQTPDISLAKWSERMINWRHGGGEEWNVSL